jgi:hypothetical protein
MQLFYLDLLYFMIFNEINRIHTTNQSIYCLQNFIGSFIGNVNKWYVYIYVYMYLFK